MERPVGAMKSVAFMNGVERWCVTLGSVCRMPLVVLKKVFNATLDPTFRVEPSSSSPGMTVCVGCEDSGFNPFI